MKHNVLTTLLVGLLLTVVGVNSVWAANIISISIPGSFTNNNYNSYYVSYPDWPKVKNYDSDAYSGRAPGIKFFYESYFTFKVKPTVSGTYVWTFNTYNDGWPSIYISEDNSYLDISVTGGSASITEGAKASFPARSTAASTPNTHVVTFSNMTANTEYTIKVTAKGPSTEGDHYKLNNFSFSKQEIDIPGSVSLWPQVTYNGTSYQSAGPNVGDWTNNGTIKFNVVPSVTGSYVLQFNTSNGNSDATALSVTADNGASVVVGETLTVNKTSNWNTYGNTHMVVFQSLTAGQKYSVTITGTGASDVCHMKNLTFTTADVSIPNSIDLANQAVYTNCAYESANQNVGCWNQNGFIEFAVCPSQTGRYNLTFNSSNSTNSNGALDVSINNSATIIEGGTQSVPKNTGSFINDHKVRFDVLTAGTYYTVRITNTAANNSSKIKNLTFSKIDPITLTYNTQGGSPSVEQASVYTSDPYGELPVVTRNHDFFNGWFSAATGGDTIKATTIITATSDHEIFAQWTPTSEVTFNAHGGVKDTTIYYATNCTYGTLPTPTRVGYIFQGWFTQETGGEKKEVTDMVTTDHTLHAQWNPIVSTVFFNAQGGTCDTKQIDVTYDDTYGTLPEPTASNHTFAGWWTDRYAGTQVLASTTVKITANQTLYAHWSGSETVTLDANGGTCGTPSMSVTLAQQYGTLPTPTRENYTFDGWYNKPQNGYQIKDTTQVLNPNNHTLYAHWSLTMRQVDGAAVHIIRAEYPINVQNNRPYYGPIEFKPAGTFVNPIVSGIWADTEEQVNGSTRAVNANESVTIKFVNALAARENVDVYVQVTPTEDLNCTWIGQRNSGFIEISPNPTGAIPWINVEMWMQIGDSVLEDDYIILSHAICKNEYERIFGTENVIFDEFYTEASSHPTTGIKYDEDEQAWTSDNTHEPTSLTDDYATAYSMGFGKNHHGKVMYKRTAGNLKAQFGFAIPNSSGPWSFQHVSVDYRGYNENNTLRFIDLNQQLMPFEGSATAVKTWGYQGSTYDHGEDPQRMGFSYKSGVYEYSDDQHKMSIYSIYRSTVSVPAHSKVKCNWNWRFYFERNGYYDYEEPYLQNGLPNHSAVYIFNSLDEARTTAVDATYDGTQSTVAADKLLRQVSLPASNYNKNIPGAKEDVLTYDNSDGDEAKEISLYMLMTNVSRTQATDRSWKDMTCEVQFAEPSGGGGVSWGTYHTTYIDFDANEGTGSMTPQVVDVLAGSPTQVTIKANEFTRSGYTFVGWNTKADGSGTAYAANAKFTAQDVAGKRDTLYAQWGKNSIVTFQPQGGEASFASKEVYQYGTYGELPTATNGTQYFDGWFTLADGGEKISSSSTVTATGDHNIYAHWLPTYTCTFDVNGAGGSVEPANKLVAYQRPYGTLPTPTRTGYTFNKWWTAASGGTEVTAETLVATDGIHSIYAHWTPITNIRVNYDANGGQVSPTYKNTLTYDQPYGSMPTPTYFPFTFAGWWTESENGKPVTKDTLVKTTATHTIYAHWYIPAVTDGTGMDSTTAKKSVTDSLTNWETRSAGTNTINVSIYRTIYKDGYFNTLCVPFDLTTDQIAATFMGTPKELKQFESASVQGSGDDREIVIETKDTTGIKAGKAYLISFEIGITLTELTFTGVQVASKEGTVTGTGDVTYNGILAPKVLPYGDQDYLFLGEENRLYWPKNDGTFLRGFRAYFKVNTTGPSAPYKRGMKASFGRTVPTSNDNVNANDNNEIKKLIEEGRVVIMSNGVKYDMNGRKIVD